MLRDPDLEMLIGRYIEQYDAFERTSLRLKKHLDGLLRELLVQGMVTSRAKSKESLKKKLKKEKERWSFQDIESGFSPPLKDLAAARVLLYKPDDIEPVTKAIKQAFQVEKDERQKSYDEPEKYHAKHLYVCLGDLANREPHPDEDGDGLAFLCEVQICTLTDHIWNELEHDIKYKQPDGKPDDSQIELLVSLHKMLRIASETIERLMARTKENRAKNQERVGDAEQLRDYLLGRFGRTLYGKHQSLFEVLDSLVGSLDRVLLNQMFEDGLPEEEAIRRANRYDPNGSEEDVGWVSLMLLPALKPEQVLSVTDDKKGLSPLFRMLRAAAAEEIKEER